MTFSQGGNDGKRQLDDGEPSGYGEQAKRMEWMLPPEKE